jgi:hypothetical protein
MPTEQPEDLTTLVLTIARKLSKLSLSQKIHVLKTVASVLGVELSERAKA